MSNFEQARESMRRRISAQIPVELQIIKAASQPSKEVVEFLEKLEEFESNSRKTVLLVR